MRRVDAGSCGSFAVAEDNEYKQFLVNGDDVPVALYEVDVEVHAKHKVLVLATSEDRAIGQAECILKVESYARDDNCQVTSSAVRRPFGIEGWARRVF